MLKQLIPHLRRVLTPSTVVQSRLQLLSSAGGTTGSLLASGLFQARIQQYSPEERAALQHIEDVRDRMRASRDTVDMIDFGAGSLWRPNEPGITSTRAVASLVRIASCPPRWGRIVFSMIRSVRPTHCLELGTHLGISGLTIASALRMNGSGDLTTIEGSPALSDYAASHFSASRLSNTCFMTGRFDDVLPGLLAGKTPFDFIFIDGHHEYAATVRYFRLFRDTLQHPSLMLFDDIRWSAGMERAWKEVSSDPAAALSVDLGSMGIIACQSAPEARLAVTIPY